MTPLNLPVLPTCSFTQRCSLGWPTRPSVAEASECPISGTVPRNSGFQLAARLSLRISLMGLALPVCLKYARCCFSIMRIGLMNGAEKILPGGRYQQTRELSQLRPGAANSRGPGCRDHTRNIPVVHNEAEREQDAELGDTLETDPDHARSQPRQRRADGVGPERSFRLLGSYLRVDNVACGRRLGGQVAGHWGG